ncbi:hypothetical protein QOS_0335, partial [Clostridioides difficile Y184]
ESNDYESVIEELGSIMCKKEYYKRMGDMFCGYR